MSKKSKPAKKEAFEPVIGFENVQENGESLSLSDFEIEGKAPRSISFFSDADKAQEEVSQKSLENLEGLNESGGLNHAFFEENSESQSDKEISNFFHQSYDNTGVVNTQKELQEIPSEKDVSGTPEIINAKVKIIEKNRKIEKVSKKRDNQEEKEKEGEKVFVIEKNTEKEAREIEKGNKREKEAEKGKKDKSPQTNSKPSVCCNCKCLIF